MVHTFVTGVTKMRRTAVILMGLTLYANAAAAQQGPGDPRQGAALARDWCTSCHVIGTQPGAQGTDAVPSFPRIARDPAKGPAYVGAFLKNPHPPMPPMPLSHIAIEDLVAYFRELQTAR